MPRKPSAVIAEAVRALAAEQDEQRAQLEGISTKLDEILKVLRTTVDGHNEHRSHVVDQFNRLGARVLRTEQRIGALELVAGGSNGAAE